MLGLPLLQKPMMATECEECGARFDLIHGGVCANCQRILCRAHLHGSWVQRMRVDLGGKQLCVACRRAGREA